jgi:hypothetical protein
MQTLQQMEGGVDFNSLEIVRYPDGPSTISFHADPNAGEDDYMNVRIDK